jgi:MFS-type transporter involved in bile tolerance (Atg22 family)
MIWGVVSAFFATIGWQVGAYGFDNTHVGLIVIWSNACGIFGCIIAGGYVEKTKKYKITCIICAYCGIACMGLFIIFLDLFKSPIPLYIASAGAGLFLFPYVTTVVELATEIAFPVGEATSGGTTLAAGQLLGFVLGLTLGLLFDGKSKEKSRIGAGIYTGVLQIGATVLFWVKEDLRKQKREKE